MAGCSLKTEQKSADVRVGESGFLVVLFVVSGHMTLCCVPVAF
jgi:hypothetical protein